MMNIPEIGIVDTRKIVKTIKDNYDYDFSEYALTSLKRRFERILILHGIKTTDQLIDKISGNQEFFNIIIKDILVESTEMFRDPSLWRWLKEKYFPAQFSAKDRLKILVPESVGGDELFSLIIVLKELNYLNKTEIIATSLHQSIIDKLMQGTCNLRKLEISTENYKRIKGATDLSTYCRLEQNYAVRDTSLLNDVEFLCLDLVKDDITKYYDLILFRNHFIFYNQTLQDKITQKLISSLKTGGHIIIGANETFGRSFVNQNFVAVNVSENVYKKK